ncbi:MAG: DUF4905 domain-containing protein [Bacteroidota bacterium]|nr:DUF4905 domain-containing protein [Bacteroidota bacterium]MDP4232013.1 DUF4905 domain-containing protein [Bacteroidota bacterium]MDP4241280.1 DUF4905 domain-containing protein [Bacteroidota bacterium]MDP4286672.1 DUF4905 domain-containing protein [Bacteroidota bacterium]
MISSSGILTGEERNIESKTGSLFAIEVLTGRVLWRGITLGEAWWFNSDRVTNDTLFVQTFRKPDLPEPKGIIAIDLHTGNIRWHQPDFSILGTTLNRVLVMRQGFTHREYCALDAMTGEIVQDFGVEQPIFPEGDELPDTFFADPIQEIPIALRSAIKVEDIRGPIDVLRHGFYEIYGLHRIGDHPDTKLLMNELIIFKKGRLVFRETIQAETPLPLPENFFVSHNILLYVKEKRTLVGVDLRHDART